MNNTDLSVKILLQKCQTEIMEKLVRENKYKIVVSIFGAAYADLGLYNSAKSYKK